MLKIDPIHSDKRGQILSLTGEELIPYDEITIFKTNARYARGGCIHNSSKEHICVLKGIIKFYTEVNSEIKEITLSTGQSYTIDKQTPHYFVSLTDSVVMEWGPGIEEKKEKNEAFRKVVEAINLSNI